MENEMETVNTNVLINDIRNQPDFKGITFSEYKKTDVQKQLLENITKVKIENSCYWIGELICSGHYSDVWEIFIQYSCKYIHLGNPKIIIYLENRYNVFKNIIDKGEYLNELQLRNHPIIRKLFCEITTTICLSEKTNSVEPIKIKKDEFDMTQISEKLTAPDIKYIQDIFKQDDPKEFFIPANEFAYSISPDKHSMLNACYWIEWTIEFEKICKKKKNKCNCESRVFVKVENKYRNDIIWILWDIIFHYAETKTKFINKCIQSCFKVFCIKYTTASCKKRRYLLYFAVSLITQKVDENIELISQNNNNILKNTINNINLIYKQIKKKEKSPNTEYLFKNMEQESAFEQSMKKMELINSIDLQNHKNI